MAMTKDELRRQLTAIEPTEETYAGLGVEDVDHLVELIRDDEDWIAARAVHALARISSDRANELIVGVTADPRREVWAAAAVAARLMPPAASDHVVQRLIDDGDAAVRKFAVQSVTSRSGSGVLARLDEVARNDADPRVRDLARRAISDAQNSARQAHGRMLAEMTSAASRATLCARTSESALTPEIIVEGETGCAHGRAGGGSSGGRAGGGEAAATDVYGGV